MCVKDARFIKGTDSPRSLLRSSFQISWKCCKFVLWCKLSLATDPCTEKDALIVKLFLISFDIHVCLSPLFSLLHSSRHYLKMDVAYDDRFSRNFPNTQPLGPFLFSTIRYLSFPSPIESNSAWNLKILYTEGRLLLLEVQLLTNVQKILFLETGITTIWNTINRYLWYDEDQESFSYLLIGFMGLLRPS